LKRSDDCFPFTVYRSLPTLRGQFNSGSIWIAFRTLQHHNVTSSQLHFITTLLHHNVTSSQHYFITPLLRYFITTLLLRDQIPLSKVSFTPPSGVGGQTNHDLINLNKLQSDLHIHILLKHHLVRVFNLVHIWIFQGFQNCFYKACLLILFY